MDPERIPDFVKNIRLAAFFGCDYIVSSHRGGAPQGQRRGDNETVAQSIRALLPIWSATG